MKIKHFHGVVMAEKKKPKKNDTSKLPKPDKIITMELKAGKPQKYKK